MTVSTTTTATATVVTAKVCIVQVKRSGRILDRLFKMAIALPRARSLSKQSRQELPCPYIISPGEEEP